ncbi:MAG TPA: MFS transporter [Solirubrobacteraceae bacterium]|nr:MFS transporter [Solirubrobacteraceae bacterium]HTX10551.1 MFS transporter [Solirubrobacteraceae bacterium]
MATGLVPGSPDRRSHLRTRVGALTLLLLCGVQFLDVVDSSITNVALPSIQRALHFSQQDLQWVASGYLLTYGGLLLLGGRLADLLGRRRILLAGLVVFGICSLVAGLSRSEEMLVCARLAQGVGAAMMAPAALSILTVTFRDGADRNTALGVWGAISGLAAAAGVFLGGVLSEGPGWRWVFYVNIPVCLLALLAASRLLTGGRARARLATFDTQGALLATGGMLLLVYGLIRAPEIGWGKAQTIALLAGAGVILTAFVLNEHNSRNPLMPLSIFRITGLAAADATWLIGMAGFFAMFFFLTLYLQEVLRFSPIQAGAALLPVTACLAVASGVASQLFTRVGTRPVIVAGALLSAAGIFLLSKIPVHGAYVSDVLPGLVLMAVGFGAVFVGVTTAANAGVPGDRAGLAAGLLSASQQVGMTLGLALLSAVATARTHHLIAAHAARPQALTSGYQQALLVCSALVAIAALIATRIPNKRVAAQPLVVPTDPAAEPVTP